MLNAKISESKIPNTSDLVTILSLIQKPMKIPDGSGLVKTTYYDAKISNIETKYFNTSDESIFHQKVLDAKINEKELVEKFDI